MQSSPPHHGSDDIDITSLWRAVMRNKWRLAAAVLCVGALTYFVLATMTPKYLAQARILIEREKSLVARPNAQKNLTEADRIDKEAVVSQVQVLNSRDLASDVVTRLQLKKRPELNAALVQKNMIGQLLALGGIGGVDARLTEEERVLDAFEDGLTVFPIPNSRVIAVEFLAADAKLAADIANRLSDSYLEWQHGRRISENKDTSIWLSKKIAELRDEVEAAEAELESFRAKSGLVKGQNNVTLNAQQLSELSSQLTLAKAQKSEAEARARSIAKMLELGTVDAAPEVLKSPLIQRLLEQRVAVQRQLSELSATLLPAHPRMRQLNSELRGLRKQIRAEARKVVRGLKNEAKIAGVREASLRESLEEARADTEQLSGNQAHLSVLEREAKSKRELYENYVSQHGDTSRRSDESTLPIYARIFQRARASSIPTFPKKGPIAVLAMVATLFLGLAIVVTRQLLTGARSTSPDYAASADEARPSPAATQAPPALDRVVPVLTQSKARSERGSAPLATAPRAMLTSIDMVAKRLQQLAQSTPGYRTLLVNATPADQWSGEAFELAEHLSNAGKRVVVTEWTAPTEVKVHGADLSQPSGLLDLIAGTANFEDVVHCAPDSSVNFIPSGNVEVEIDPSDEVERLNLAFDALDQTYDHVLITGSLAAAREFLIKIGGRLEACILIANGSISEPQSQNLLDELARSLPKGEVMRYGPNALKQRHEGAGSAGTAGSTAAI